MARIKREQSTYDVDLSKPLSKLKQKEIAEKETAAQSCFGVEWDAADNNCAICADNDVCCIFHRKVVDSRAREVEKRTGSYFLDRTDFESVDKEKLLFQIDLKSGVWTFDEMVSYIGENAKTSDRVAIIQWIKRFREETAKAFSVKQDGIVIFNKK